MLALPLDHDLALAIASPAAQPTLRSTTIVGAVVEAAAVVAHRAVEADRHVGRLPDAEVVARARVLDHDLAHALVGQAAQLAVESLGPGVGVDHGRRALEIDAGGHHTISW